MREVGIWAPCAKITCIQEK